MIWYRIFHKAAILFRVPLFFAVKAVCQGVWRIVVCQGVQTASTDMCAQRTCQLGPRVFTPESGRGSVCCVAGAFFAFFF